MQWVDRQRKVYWKTEPDARVKASSRAVRSRRRTLARLGEDGGRNRLVELAAEPVCRLRAIHYADELGIGDLINEDLRSDEATAEADMSLWMSQPQQMGVPPTKVEVVESRRLLWPSFRAQSTFT